MVCSNCNPYGGPIMTFTFGAGVDVSDVESIIIAAQDNAGTPNVGANPSAGAAGFTANPPAAATPPTTPSSYSIGGSLSGSFNVGTAQVYTTLTAAIAAYNTSCLTGPVTFLLTDAAYTEAAAMTINANADASATNTLTIKPTLANTTIAVTGGSATAILTLNGADFVTIDGSNSGGTDKSLTIENTASTSNSTVIWVSSLFEQAQVPQTTRLKIAISKVAILLPIPHLWHFCRRNYHFRWRNR
ncbi:MAG: hypothetical protein IPK25_19230 [Saprospiraceae bacterium]|nr:hypothetical protein [Saprospiraceae bacterium]